MGKQYRHGDVFLVPSTVPDDAMKDKEEKTLAWGEVTGHSHRVDNGVVMVKDGQRYLVVPDGGGTLTHEEHGPILVEPGEYEIRIQREYTPQAIRQVVD